ncbi:LuxR family transcriptional regulator [Petrocella sp. FN5]|uniref:LuxR family transcriptional regulator n=1 Tax=Petrocella sp. FN5 TaxID=3032002 RepID=UPI0023D9B225|nr:LuxR family transcriptional regulator [Petrocella sp. FN5]MDF1617986.1 LuxR family transcriptional regulator [Petrocella sp. FN5]
MQYYKNRHLIMINFVIVFGWIMSFPYEGPVMYAMIYEKGLDGIFLNRVTVFFVFLGLFTGRFISKDIVSAKKVITVCTGMALVISLFVPFIPIHIWNYLIPFLAFITGIVLSVHGYMIKGYILAKSRSRMVADVLIYANVMLVAAHILANNTSPLFSYIIIEVLLIVAFVAALHINTNEKLVRTLLYETGKETSIKSYWILFLFIFVITINSGIMFQVIYPYFSQFTVLTSIYTNIPYILAIYLLSRIYKKCKFYLLYVGLALWGITFILFAFMGQTALGFIIICSTMLFAAGIFDLFWWSVMANNFDNVKSPSSLFGLGLSINVLGVWVGGVIGNALVSLGANKEALSFMGLFVVVISMLIIVPLNNKLSSQLEYNEFIVEISYIEKNDMRKFTNDAKELLSKRERQVFDLLIKGKTDTEISKILYITHHTIKTHNRSIYKKLNVSNRIELIDKIVEASN